MTVSLSRQLATGLAAFVVTALLALANAPAARTEGRLPLAPPAATAQVLTVLTLHG